MTVDVGTDFFRKFRNLYLPPTGLNTIKPFLVKCAFLYGMISIPIIIQYYKWSQNSKSYMRTTLQLLFDLTFRPKRWVCLMKILWEFCILYLIGDWRYLECYQQNFIGPTRHDAGIGNGLSKNVWSERSCTVAHLLWWGRDMNDIIVKPLSLDLSQHQGQSFFLASFAWEIRNAHIYYQILWCLCLQNELLILITELM